MRPLRKYLRRLFFIILILGLTSLGIYGGHRAWKRSSAELSPLSITLTAKEFTINIQANGELQSEESTAIAVPSVPVENLRIATVVPDGHHVEKGDVLVE